VAMAAACNDATHVLLASIISAAPALLLLHTPVAPSLLVTPPPPHTHRYAATAAPITWVEANIFLLARKLKGRFNKVGA
jgi:hypothetical protein